MSKPKGPKPEKPDPKFPLFPHAAGTWCKTIHGRQVHFGVWRDPMAALKRYRQYTSDAAAGRLPERDGVTLQTLSNRFLTHHEGRAQTGEISLRTFRDMLGAVKAFARAIGPQVRVEDIEPEDFRQYRQKVSAHVGAHALNHHLTLIKQLFRWGYNQGIIEQAVRYGDGFSKAPLRQIRKARRVRLFTGDEIRRMVDAADGPIKAMILLGINAGFGNTDVATLPMSALELPRSGQKPEREEMPENPRSGQKPERENVGGWLTYPRPKTGIARRCPLWPETVQALRDALKVRPRPLDKAHDGLVFVTYFGRPYVRTTARGENGVIEGAACIDALAGQFSVVCGKVGIYKPAKVREGERPRFVSDGRAFYTLRRTHRTFADEVTDPHAAALIMGHEVGGIASLYVQHVSDERLKRVTDHIRGKVWPAAAGTSD